VIDFAKTLWARLRGSPSGNSTAGREWDFKLVWLNSCGVDQPCGFYLYPADPQVLPNLQVDATTQAATIKSAALAALKKAFHSFPVAVSEGSPNTGDHRANVLNGFEIGPGGTPVCGATDNQGVTSSRVYYQLHMENAQWALPITLRNLQDVQNALSNVILMKAIGTGIGNTAAHELGHQFFVGSGMEDNSTNTYNGKLGCDPAAAGSGPWNYGFGPISWEAVTFTAWANALVGGYHR
jgi:hypothetical protein